MTIEVILLLALSVFFFLGTMVADFGGKGFFPTSAPRLAARLERNLMTGSGFVNSAGEGVKWEVPNAQNGTDTGALR